MKKIAIFLIFTTFIFAKIVDAVAIIVNNEPITLYEIVKTYKTLKIDKKKAIELLIEQKILDSQIKKYGIKIDEFELENELDKFAKKNGLTLDELKDILSQKGIDWEEYKKEFKKKLLKKKFFQKIASSKLTKPDDQELLEYYKKNIEEFSIPKYVEIIKYLSANKDRLKIIQNNPFASVKGVKIEEERVDVSKIDPKFAYILQSTKENRFTPIIPIGKNYLLIYIKKKIDVTPMRFENVKNAILAKMMEKKKEEIIKEYIAKLKANAKIKVLRIP